MNPKRKRSPILYVVCLVMAAQGLLLAALPTSTGYVNDFAAVLDPASRAELDALLREVEAETTAEIAVATVPSLEGLTVEEYANRLFKEWGIGQKATDNGVLVLVAPTEREMRIEVGYGLEPVLPDGLAGEIIRTDFLPRFRDGDYRNGILQGVRRVAEIVRRSEPLSADERRRLEESGTGNAPWMIIPFLGLFVALGAFGVGVGLRTRTFFPLIWGGMFGGIPLVISFGMFSAAVAILAPVALGMLAWGYVKGKSPGWSRNLRGASAGSGSDGWVMGTDSSDSSSGSSGSSGSSFGGGSSGGGGASGKW